MSLVCCGATLTGPNTCPRKSLVANADADRAFVDKSPTLGAVNSSTPFLNAQQVYEDTQHPQRVDPDRFFLSCCGLRGRSRGGRRRTTRAQCSARFPRQRAEVGIIGGDTSPVKAPRHCAITVPVVAAYRSCCGVVADGTVIRRFRRRGCGQFGRRGGRHGGRHGGAPNSRSREDQKRRNPGRSHFFE